MKARIIILGLISLFLLVGRVVKNPTDTRNITLYNPLSVIKHCIQGKWKLYMKGGFIATRIQYWDDYYMEF